jgi:predicted glutamine amidotransferase
MCRLFGFRSVIPSMMHRSLVAAENALSTQSRRHPDGWGVAYYVDGAPHLVKSAATAVNDHLFHRVSGIVSSETVVAHVRKATVGPTSVLNSHPFQHGRWVFAHNGTIPRFDEIRPKLLELISPGLRRFILGDTDSEVVFFLFLTAIARGRDDGVSTTIPDALAEAVRVVRELADARAGVERAALTLMVTDGISLFASRSGRQLFYSTYKSRCADRAVCPSFAPHCEAPATGVVNHMIISSEPLGGENIWIEVPEGNVVGVDPGMNFITRPLLRRGLDILSEAS